MSNNFYFSHDYNSRNDPKLQAIIMDFGLDGIGIFWCLVEMMYEQGGKLELSQCERYAFSLRTNKEKILEVIKIAFKSDKNYFWSDAVLERLKQREEKSKLARKSASYRWINRDKNANALHSQCDSNATKERKGKENKGKEIIIHTNVSLFLEEFNKLFERQYKPTAGRIKKLSLRLKSFSLEDILTATRNLAKSPFHRGVNDRGWTADPDFLIRNDEQIDKWLNVNMEEAKQLSKFSKEAKNANKFIGSI